jgi:RNA polymerase sigma-70 factor (ECF subfamily)
VSKNGMSQSESNAIREQLLVVRAQNRDERAFHELVTRYERRILYYIHRLLGRDADLADVMQEIWIRVFLRITTLRAPEAFRVWLYKIAHHVAVNHLRKNIRREIASLEDTHAAESAGLSDWNEYELLENAELVHKTLERLSLAHREVLTLRFLEGLDLSEIAEVVGCNVGTAKSRLYYAKSAMRKLLEASRHE